MTNGLLPGYARQDGRKGIRNVILVAYLVECAHHASKAIASRFATDEVEVIGFPGCYPNSYAHQMLTALCTHPNVGGVLLVSLGCESFDRDSLSRSITATGRWSETIVIQGVGGSKPTVSLGIEAVERGLKQVARVPRTEVRLSDLIIGAECGGSDGTSGITANPAVGFAFDQMVAEGATCIFEEPGELLGTENHMAARASSPDLGLELVHTVEKASDYYHVMGHGSFSPGNYEGGLTTIEEKSIGAYAKSGTSTIRGLLKPAVQPTAPGLYLMDPVPDGPVRWGFPNINDTATVIEMVACGAQIILFTTGRGSVVGSAISPVIKVCANPDTYERMPDDMDVNAGAILTGDSTIPLVGAEIVELVRAVAGGAQTKSEEMGHREFTLGYKSFDPLGPSCLPASA
jgi:altronate dehydratase large subunit